MSECLPIMCTTQRETRVSERRENLPKSTVRCLILWLPQNATFSMDIHSNKKRAERERRGDVGGGDGFKRNRGGFSRFSLAQKALSAVVAIISRRVIY